MRTWTGLHCEVYEPGRASTRSPRTCSASALCFSVLGCSSAAMIRGVIVAASVRRGARGLARAAPPARRSPPDRSPDAGLDDLSCPGRGNGGESDDRSDHRQGRAGAAWVREGILSYCPEALKVSKNEFLLAFVAFTFITKVFFFWGVPLKRSCPRMASQGGQDALLVSELQYRRSSWKRYRAFWKSIEAVKHSDRGLPCRLSWAACALAASVSGLSAMTDLAPVVVSFFFIFEFSSCFMILSSS